MPKPSLCITIWVLGCLLKTSTSMSVPVLATDTTAETVTEGENQGTEFTFDTISTVTSGDDQPPGTEQLNCTYQELQPEDVIQLGKSGKLLIKPLSTNLTLTLSQKFVYDPAQGVCFRRGELLNQQIFAKCMKWPYKEDEFSVRDDGTVMLYKDVLEPGSYSIKDGTLKICADDEEKIPEEKNNVNSTKREPYVMTTFDKLATYTGQVGCSISIVALTAHLVSFCLVPTMRNLPGYNLASLSVAFLLGYLFTLIGQIPEVLGFFCVLCGIFVQYFFLAAFFCMNTLAFDVWRTLKMATTQLATSSHNTKRREFMYYSMYFWGVPLVVTITSVIIDNVPTSLDWLKPDFGKNDICWMTNNKAKWAFFTIPAFALFIANALFFVRSAFIIRTNTMKATSDEQRKTARHNFVLYFRLGAMMGVTWLFGIFSAILADAYVWLLFDLINSLQGLFIFLLFTCSKKVIGHVRDKMHLHATLGTPKTSTTDLSGRKISSTSTTDLWGRKISSTSTTDLSGRKISSTSTDAPVKTIHLRPCVDPI